MRITLGKISLLAFAITSAASTQAADIRLNGFMWR